MNLLPAPKGLVLSLRDDVFQARLVYMGGTLPERVGESMRSVQARSDECALGKHTLVSRTLGRRDELRGGTLNPAALGGGRRAGLSTGAWVWDTAQEV